MFRVAPCLHEAMRSGSGNVIATSPKKSSAAGAPKGSSKGVYTGVQSPRDAQDARKPVAPSSLRATPALGGVAAKAAPRGSAPQSVNATRAPVGGAAVKPIAEKRPIRATSPEANLAANPGLKEAANGVVGGNHAASPDKTLRMSASASGLPKKAVSMPQVTNKSTDSLKSPSPRSPPASPQSQSRSTDGPGRKLFVLARCRPDVQKNESCLEIESGTLPAGDAALTPPSITITDYRKQSRVFSNFHAVIDSREQGPNSSQEAVYNIIGPQCIADLNSGQNCCIFAYGQTGTGKSHTLIGVLDSQEERGVLPRLCSDIFGAKPDNSLQVSCSAVELYNDQIRDLFRVPSRGKSSRDDDGAKVTLRSTPRLGTHIDGAQELVAHDSAELLGHCKYATSMRAVAETVMNAQSSRSHAIFIIKLEWPSKRISATIFVADLAGHETEKTVLSMLRAERLRELSFINTTLLHLRQVISALADRCTGRDRNVHVPYRNSKLTMMLERALEGSGRCTTVVTLTADGVHYDENLHTLRFAADLSDIRTKPQRKAMATKEELLRTAQEEVETLKQRLKEMQSKSAQATDEWSNVQQELEDAKKLAGLFQSSWVNLQQKTREHQNTIRKMGLAVEIDGSAGVPYLVNLSNDPQLAGTLCYELPLGLTALGAEASSDAESGVNQIIVQGLGVVPEMLRLEITQQMGSNTGLNVEALPCLQRGVDAAPRVLVNGLRLSHPTQLKDGDRILLGCRVAFRLVMPGSGETKQSRSPDTSACLEDVLLEAAGDSETIQALTPFTDFLQTQAGELQAHAFLIRYRRIAASIEEANQISRVLRRGDRLVFAVSVTMDLASVDTAPVDFVVTLSKRSFKSAGRTVLERLKKPWQQVEDIVSGKVEGLNHRLATWTVDNFNRRFELMRELYSLYSLDGDAALEHIEQHILDDHDDPWSLDQEDTRPLGSARLKVEKQSLEEKNIETQTQKAIVEPVEALKADLETAVAERDALRDKVALVTKSKDSKLQDMHEMMMRLKALELENKQLKAELDEVRKPPGNPRSPRSCTSSFTGLFH